MWSEATFTFTQPPDHGSFRSIQFFRVIVSFILGQTVKWNFGPARFASLRFTPHSWSGHNAYIPFTSTLFAWPSELNHCALSLPVLPTQPLIKQFNSPWVLHFTTKMVVYLTVMCSSSPGPITYRFMTLPNMTCDVNLKFTLSISMDRSRRYNDNTGWVLLPIVCWHYRAACLILLTVLYHVELCINCRYLWNETTTVTTTQEPTTTTTRDIRYCSDSSDCMQDECCSPAGYNIYGVSR